MRFVLFWGFIQCRIVVLRHCTTSRTVSGSIPCGVTLGIISVATDGTMYPGVESKNEYQVTPLGVKAAGA
jgi:hypothetical protein